MLVLGEQNDDQNVQPRARAPGVNECRPEAFSSIKLGVGTSVLFFFFNLTFDNVLPTAPFPGSQGSMEQAPATDTSREPWVSG